MQFQANFCPHPVCGQCQLATGFVLNGFLVNCYARLFGINKHPAGIVGLGKVSPRKYGQIENCYVGVSKRHRPAPSI